MSTDYTVSSKMDELDLCKLIASELAEGPHTVEEIYGMLMLILRLKDKPKTTKTSHFTDYSILPMPPLGG